MPVDFCPARIFRRSFISKTGDTILSFKSWDTCMDNKICKIIAIVGIVLASITSIYIVGSLLRCFKVGVSGIFELLFWPCLACSRRSRRSKSLETQKYTAPLQMAYQPVMQPPAARYINKDDYYSEHSGNAHKESKKYYDIEAQKRNRSYNAPSGREPITPIVYDEDVDHREELIWSTQKAGQRVSNKYIDSAAWNCPKSVPYPDDSALASSHTPVYRH